MFKKYLALLTILAMLLASTALAEGPTSQFGFTGWPYRQSTNCNTGDTQEPTIPTQAPGTGVDRPNGALPTAVPPTEAPVSPTVAPTSVPPVPTQKPAATRVPSTEGDYTTQSPSAQEQMMLNLLNQDRKNYGLPALTLDATLSSIARIKSCDMRDNN